MLIVCTFANYCAVVRDMIRLTMELEGDPTTIVELRDGFSPLVLFRGRHGLCIRIIYFLHNLVRFVTVPFRMFGYYFGRFLNYSNIFWLFFLYEDNFVRKAFIEFVYKSGDLNIPRCIVIFIPNTAFMVAMFIHAFFTGPTCAAIMSAVTTIDMLTNPIARHTEMCPWYWFDIRDIGRKEAKRSDAGINFGFDYHHELESIIPLLNEKRDQGYTPMLTSISFEAKLRKAWTQHLRSQQQETFYISICALLEDVPQFVIQAVALPHLKVSGIEFYMSLISILFSVACCLGSILYNHVVLDNKIHSEDEFNPNKTWDNMLVKQWMHAR